MLVAGKGTVEEYGEESDRGKLEIGVGDWELRSKMKDKYNGIRWMAQMLSSSNFIQSIAAVR